MKSPCSFLRVPESGTLREHLDPSSFPALEVIHAPLSFFLYMFFKKDEALFFFSVESVSQESVVFTFYILQRKIASHKKKKGPSLTLKISFQSAPH